MSRRSACAWAIERANRCAMPAAERLLYVVLVDRAGEAGYCSPSQHILMDDTGLVDRHIRRLTDKLERRGYIRTEKHGRTLYYHIVRANGMDPEPKKHRTQSPVSAPSIPDTVSSIDPPTPDTESPIPGRYRTPVPVFEAVVAQTPDTESGIEPKTAPPPRARVDSPILEKKEEERVPVVREGEEGSAEGRGGNHAPAAARGAHKLPKAWIPNAYSLSLGYELGFSDAEVAAEAAAMRDWSLSVNKRRHDWDRQFNNWLRKAAKDRYIRKIRTSSEPTIAEQWGLTSFLTPVFDDDDLPPSERPGAPRLQ